MKRIAIYFFYDEFGIVDDYVYYFLNALKAITERLVFVANGNVKQEYLEKLKSITNDIILRENKGLDVYAYKCAFDTIGWNELEKYDQLIYCNSTFCGPIYPLENMFDEMENRNIDFWGITKHPDYFEDNILLPEFDNSPYGGIKEHIQHYFMVYNKNLIKSEALHSFWNNLPEINTYSDSVVLFETVFTKYFADLGYKWDTYVNYDFKKEDTTYLLLYKPYTAIKKYQSPVLKMKTFFLENMFTKKHNTKEEIEKAIEYINNNNLYDKDLIYRNINRLYKDNNL